MSKKKLVLLFILLLIATGLYLFNFKSHLQFITDSDGEATNYQVKNQDVLHDNDEVLIRRIHIKRKDQSFANRLINLLSRPTVYYLEFKQNNHDFTVAYYDEGSTAPSNVSDDTKFSVNSAFYNEDFEPNGLIIVDGKHYGRESRSSGHFKVIDGKAKAGPTSIFEDDSEAQYSCQSHPSVMKDGIIWDYILNESMKEAYWGTKTYRSLVGQHENGNICFILSGNGGLLSIKEISLIAKANDIQTATCLDAGSALQYVYQDQDYKLSFSSMNNKLSLGTAVDKLSSRLIGKRFYSESPAFINYQ